MAYVICFGHFPKDDDVATRNQGTTGGAPPVVAEPLAQASDVPESPSQSSTSDDQNPFLDDQNPLSEDQSPIAQESSSGGDQSPLKEEESSPVEAQNVANEDSNSANVSQSSLFSEQSLPGGSDPSRQTPPADVPSPSTPEKGPSSPAPATTPESPLTPTPAPAALPSKVMVEVGSVSRAHAKEVIAEAFNVTHLDLRHLVEDIGKNKVSCLLLVSYTDPKFLLVYPASHINGLIYGVQKNRVSRWITRFVVGVMWSVDPEDLTSQGS